MDATTVTSASEPQSSRLNEVAIHSMPSSDQHSPDAITETNSSSAPATAPVGKSPARSLTAKLKFNTRSPLFGKSKGKDKAIGKEKEVATTTAPATEDELVTQGGEQEEAGAAKKGGWLKKNPIGKVARKVMGLFA